MPGTVLSLQANFLGGYKSTQTEINTEIWVNTLRLAVTLGDPPTGVATIPAQFDVVAATLTDSGTGWSGHSAWRLEGGVDDFDPLSWLVDQAMPAALSWMALTGRSDKAILKAIHLYPIDNTGHAIAAPGTGAPVPAVLDFDAGSEPGGSSSGDMDALQVSCVASHRTAFNGRKGRGRMFLAGLAEVATDAQGQFTSTFVNAVLAKQTTFLSDLAVTGSVSVRPALIPDWTKWAVIESVKVGTKPDTQRRRARQIPETYVSDSVTY